ncbi:MAG: 5-oxoprolinase subunit PxpB [Lachnospiraceae bacterium]|nr:5-oxoprolinase subunit PxpB [Lachnospiraceae bacterium]
MEDVKILTEGDTSILIAFKQEISPEVNAKIAATVKLIRQQQTPGIVDVIPTYASLLINYNPQVISYGQLKRRLTALLKMDLDTESSARRVFEIPVCYGGEYGPDLHTIAEHAGLSEEEVIRIHSSTEYLIYMLGFLPGFCYLGGLDERIHTPRLANPRKAIPAGSVGIGGSQTGIYPMESPGGWQLMGKTPVRTYDPDREVPILVYAGEYIHFYPVDEDEFNRIKAAVDDGTYEVTIREGSAPDTADGGEKNGKEA